MNNKKNSNRGGALLSVVIVMAIAGILGALAISIAYTNFTMKVVDKKSKDNFYSAEKVLEEICTGLQKEASDQYKSAYTYVMSRYNTYQDVAKMTEEFNSMFVVNLISEIQVTGNSGKYNIGLKANASEASTGLYQYVKSNYGTAEYTISSSTATNNTIDTLEDGLCIRNLTVEYQDGNYYNKITTDIKIAIPDVSFAMISAMPEIGEFSFIAEGGVNVNGSVDVELVGKAYAGVGNSTDKTSITLGNNSSFDATDSNTVLLVAKGDVALKGSAEFSTGNKTALWANSITANMPGTVDSNGKPVTTSSNVIDLKGRTYIKDDTTLNGTTNTLNLAGQYYGFSNKDDDADMSSSIIINGQTTTLNMSNLDTLVIAGTSFVATKDSAYGSNTTSKDILMGDSIAIKSNQLAYLVPTECAGIVSNPMTYDQFNSLPTGWEDAALATYLPMIRSSLAAYGDVEIVPVFEQNRNGNGGTVYLYLNFMNSEKASDYFMDYYGMNKYTVNHFINNYLGAITFNSTANGMTRIVTQGNHLVPGTGSEKAKYEGSTGDAALTAQELANYNSSFSALCKKLITNESALTTEEQSKTVYQNLVDEANVEAFIAAAKTAGATLNNVTVSGNTAIINNGEEVEAIIVDNAGDSAYLVDSTHKAGLLIATGDVNITGSTAAIVDFEGLIVCGGKLTVNGNVCNMEHNPDYIGKAMQMTCDVTVSGTTKTYTVLNFFKSGSNYSTGSFGDNVELTDVRNCITYENYKSE